MKNNKRIPLLRYWTTTYVGTLIIGLAVLTLVSAILIRQSTLRKNLDINKYLAEETAVRVLDQTVGTDMHNDENIPKVFRDREKLVALSGNPTIYIVDNQGNILSYNHPNLEFEITSFPVSLLNSKSEVKRLENINGDDYYLVKRPIAVNNNILGWAVVVQSKAELTKVDQEYRLLTLMILSVAMLGWAAIYFFSKRLVQPIQNVAEAAKKVQEGNYDIDLIEEVREQEVYELVQSFKEMAYKLEQLESMRAELLAGVTHELKTPVTSISGLLQAVNDGVVTGEEAKEFLAISQQETIRMQKMIGDLLEFNSFTANAIPVSPDRHNLTDLVKEMVYQWEIVQDDPDLKVSIIKPDEELPVLVDSLRLQQIIINLLNNARQAVKQNASIQVDIYQIDASKVAIDIKDNGIGIPPKEQTLIFERFYRGEEKKFTVRGLGLGLPFSKMLANAMKGDLSLKESSEKGTIFTITLPLDDKKVK